MQIIVLGMHRSGTSMLARLLNMMGLYFGAEGSSTGLNEENPKGFWERQDVRKLNDYILQKNGFDWNRISDFESTGQFSEETKKHFIHEGKKIILGMDAFRPWFLKEPRFCLTLPLWRELLEVPVVIHIYRDPFEVASSLQKRNNFPIEYGLAMWERYNQLALLHSGDLPIISINHSLLVQKPYLAIDLIKRFLEDHGVPNLRQPSDKEVSGFIEKRFYRNRRDHKLNSTLNKSQMNLWDLIEQKASVTDFETSTQSKRILSQYEMQMEKENILLEEIERLKISNNDLKNQLDNKNISIRQYERTINDNEKKLREFELEKIAAQKISNLEWTKLKSENNDLRNQVDSAKSEISKKNLTITHLKKDLSGKEKLIVKKDKLLGDYWSAIQEMRISNRLKKAFGFGRVKKIIRLPIDFLKVLKYKWIIKKKANSIEKFVKNEFDHLFPAQLPLVTIIILNRNGLSHLKNLIKYLRENTIYPNFEVIVFDNKSSDGSINFLKTVTEIPLRVIENHFNDTFSAANNKAANEANGELLLFLNNDVMPLYGWLNQMVKTYLETKDVGLVGSKLIYPKDYIEKDTLKIQHNGIGFKAEVGFLRPYNLDGKRDFFELNHDTNCDYPSVTAACVLVGKREFEMIGGFDENYNYGYEDVDLGLKFFEKNKKNIVAKGSVLYHNEFGTQSVQHSTTVKTRRQKNLEHFRNKWYRKLLDISWHDKLKNADRLSLAHSRLTIGITVTEQGEYARAGDFFTARELADEFVKLGYRVRFYAQKEENWYQLHDDVDVLLVLLHGYDLNKINCKNKNLIKAAWIRNWFDKFSDSNWFKEFDLVFSSSKKACKYIENEKRKKAYYLPIATNDHKFGNTQKLVDNNYECDYCFTGSYWNDPREIIDMLKPEKLPDYKFNLYGKNWDQVEKLSKYDKGFVKYGDIPKVYANTKLLIDDANRVTKPWGSVNSRVFDALMSGVLVITNGELGSKDVFQGKLPVYSNANELERLIKYYLNDDQTRQEKVKELQQIVKTKHTYKHRANEVKKVLKKYYEESLVIKIPVPKKEVAHQWGDYHFALSLQKEFEKKGFRTKVELLPDWNSEQSYSFKNVLVLRGLSIYRPRPFQFNMMWNISHPDKVDLQEYSAYDHVFVASKKWTKNLKDQGLKNVSTLLQCTDPDVFKIPKKKEKVENELLFVGNSRGVYRKIIKDLLPTEYNLSIYGSGWEGLVDASYIKGTHIKNKDLYKYYGGAKIVLNDHWDDMKEKGFVSNRIFDALASGARVITDDVRGLSTLRSRSIATYKTSKHLEKIIKRLLVKKKENTRDREVLKKHTFKSRVGRILKIIK